MSNLPQLIKHVQNTLGNGLPGREAQFEMAAIGRPHLDAPIRDDVRSASVLISLLHKDNDWHTTVIKRKVIEGDRHSGQISFPGGRREEGEPLEQTAIRESYEEIGTPVESVKILGQLTKLHIPVSNFIVYPFVGYVEEPYPYIPQESEVAEIYEIRIQDLLDHSNRRRKDIRVPEGFLLKDVPYFDLAGEVVWGATAMIMSEFVSVLRTQAPNSRHQIPG